MELYYGSEHSMIIFYANLVCACLSVLGSCFILFLCLFFPRLRKLPFRLIIYLAISDLGNSIAFVLPYYLSDSVCQAQGFLDSYFGLSSILWCGCISHAIKSTILEDAEVKNNVKKYFFICFFLPALCFLVLIDIQRYRTALGWCWIYLDNNPSPVYYRQLAYRMSTYYIPLITVIIFIIYNYIKVVTAIKKSESFLGMTSVIGENLILKLRLYPIVLVLSTTPVAVLRIASLWWNPPWYLTLISGIGISINGFFNSIVYGLTQEVRTELSKVLNGIRAESQNMVEVE